MRRRPHWAGELLVVIGLLFVYDFVSGQARVRTAAANANGSALLRLEHFPLERHADLWLARTSWLHAPSAYYYDLAHILVTMAALLAAYVFRPGVYRRARWALIGINLVGLVTFFAYPVTPPRLLPGSGFVDIVANSHTWGAWEASGKVTQHANELASMPSLHAAWALWVALTVASMTMRRPWRAAAWLHVALTGVVVIITGNHYLLDVVAGVAVTAASWLVVGRRPRSTQQAARVDASPALVD